jgi:hypothetical protein
VVARRTGLHITSVICIVDALCEAANKAKPRGALAEFSIVECATDLDLPEENVARVYVALEAIGWIDQDQIATWAERQPQNEDPTAAQRQRNRRARLKAEKETALAGYPPSRVTPVTQRDVTPEQSRAVSEGLFGGGLRSTEASRDVEGAHSNSGDSGDESRPFNPALWLAVEGKRIVATRCAMYPPRAQLEIERWLKDVGDEALLADVLHNADLLGKTGGTFMDIVRQEIGRRRQEAKGPSLPLMPPRPRSRRTGSGDA